MLPSGRNIGLFSLLIDETTEQRLMYLGSAANNEGGCKIRVGAQHCNKEFRTKNPKMLYHAMDEPGAVCEWRPIGAPENDDMVHSATMRIVEAVSVATMHTFRSVKYTSFLKKYGMVETEVSLFHSLSIPGTTARID